MATVDPVGDFGLDGLGQKLLRSRAKDLREDISRLGQWHDANLASGRQLLAQIPWYRAGRSPASIFPDLG
jgi:hypothetical protein